MRKEARDWWEQGQHDLSVARDMLQAGHWAVCVFHGHEACKKALKGLHISGLRRMPGRWDNNVELAQALELPEELVSFLRESNNDYKASRYPDVAMGVPAEMFDERIAQERLGQAEQVMEWVQKELTGAS